MPTAVFAIRKAVAADVPAIYKLVQELALYEKAPEEVTQPESHFLEAGFGPHPVWSALVACHEGGEVIGFALWYTRFSTWKGLRLWLEDFYVQPSFRGTGAGQMLWAALLNEARSSGFTGMMWQVLTWNEPAIRFYRKAGASLSDEWLNGYLDFEKQ